MKRIFWRWVWFFLAGVIFMVFTSSAAMASGIQITEKGTKGLGNAWAGGAAVAEDASTVYWNPAGLTRLDGNHVELSMHFIRPSFKFDDDGSTTVLGLPLTGSDGGDAGGPNFVPNFFYSHAFGDRWRAGIGIVSPFGLETDYDDDWKGRYYSTKSSLLTIDINPCVAYRINKHFSVGAGISAQYIDAELKNKVDYGTINAAAPIIGLPPPFPLPGLTPQQDDGKATVEADDWSWGFNLGVLFELSENTRFGLAYRSKVEYDDDDGDATFRTPAAAQPLANALDLVDTGTSIDLDLPANASLSAYHKLTEKWAVFTMPSGRPGTTMINGPSAGALPMMKHRYPVPRKELRASRMMTVTGFRRVPVMNFWIAGELISPAPIYGPMAILKSRRRLTPKKIRSAATSTAITRPIPIF
jgi:long-chain fatty acid transport protein